MESSVSPDKCIGKAEQTNICNLQAFLPWFLVINNRHYFI